MLYILICDYLGNTTKNSRDPDGLISKIRERYPLAIILPILNGGHTQDLVAIADEYRGQWIQPLVSEDWRRGMVAASQAGYRHIIENNPEATVVKIDDAEHPIEHIENLEAAANTYGSAIAELDFSNGGLVEGSYDYWIHREVFPTIYGAATKGRLRLSCAHGFQAHQAEHLAAAFEIANRIVREVERYTESPMAWGFDGAMAIGAVLAKTSLQMVPVASHSIRNRNTNKINDQLRKHSLLLAAVTRLGLF